MNDEIKEILKILKKCEFGACITKHNSKVLLDYITNLQNENEDYKSRIEKAVENLKLKQIRYVNESDYVIDDGDLQEEINILQNGSDEEC